MLHRLAELDQRVKAAVSSYDWAGVFPDLHNFCATDLSAFYFDIRKDALYCDRPDSPRRRAVRTVLDQLHRCLCIWFAPVLVFTAEEAWWARFGEESSVHLQMFPEVPALWLDPTLSARWGAIRESRAAITGAVEVERREKRIGSSLEAAVILAASSPAMALLNEADWAELAIVSQVMVAPSGAPVTAQPADGTKCVRCWRVLPEVGRSSAHPGLCLRCEDAVGPAGSSARPPHDAARAHGRGPGIGRAGAGRRPGQQILGVEQPQPAGPRQCVGAATVPGSDDGVEQWRHLRAAEGRPSHRPVGAVRHRDSRSGRVVPVAAARRKPAGGGPASAPSRVARSATWRTATGWEWWWISSMCIGARSTRSPSSSTSAIRRSWWV